MFQFSMHQKLFQMHFQKKIMYLYKFPKFKETDIMYTFSSLFSSLSYNWRYLKNY